MFYDVAFRSAAIPALRGMGGRFRLAFEIVDRSEVQAFGAGSKAGPGGAIRATQRKPLPAAPGLRRPGATAGHGVHPLIRRPTRDRING